MNFSQYFPIETSSRRITIESLKAADWPQVLAMFNDPLYQQFNCESYSENTAEDIEGYVRFLSEQNLNKPAERYVLCIRATRNSQCIGLIGLKSGEIKIDGQIELYYVIAKEERGKGIMSEAINALLDILFRKVKMHRIFAGTDIENLASKRVLEKSGMRLESLWRKDRMRNGKWKDGLGFSLLCEDYK